MWPGKPSLKLQNQQMKKSSGGSKRKMSASPDPVMDTDVEEGGGHSPGCEVVGTRRAFPSPELPSAVFEDDMRDLGAPRHERESHGPPRLPAAGYRIDHHNRTALPKWGHEYLAGYDHSPRGPYRKFSRRPLSPVAYGSGRNCDQRSGDYSGRALLYDARTDCSDCRDLYYDNRVRELDRQQKEYEDYRRYEEGKYEIRNNTVDRYASAKGAVAGSPYPQSSRRGSSAAPSSSAIVENEVKSTDKARRPLHVDKYGHPTGAMAALVNGDISSFVKDMDPRVGWDGQTREAKQRLIDRIMDDYEIHGESSRLNEKYIRKQASTALIQYRFSLNQFIERGCDRPKDVNPVHWEDLVNKRASREGKQISERMATIARGRGSQGSTKKAVRELVIVHLTRHLKRDPFLKEIEDVVEKEWGAIQEENARKKKMRVAANAVNAGDVANRDIEKRLEIVESFMHKWGPQLEILERRQSEVKELNLTNTSPVTDAAANDLDIVATEEENEQMEAVEEDKAIDSNDESEGNLKSKASANDEIESDKEKQDSDEEALTLASLSPLKVVEAVDETLKIQKNKSTAGTADVSMKKAKGTNNKSGTLVRAPQNVSSDATMLLSKRKENPSAAIPRVSTRTTEKTMGSASDKKDGSTAIEKDKDVGQQSLKRQKTDSKSTADPVLEEAKNAVHSSSENEGTAKITKVVQKNAKSANTNKMQEVQPKGTKTNRKNVKSAKGKVDKGGKKVK